MSLLNRTPDENMRALLILIPKVLDSRDDNAVDLAELFDAIDEQMKQGKVPERWQRRRE